jgi:hypothetical protein
VWISESATVISSYGVGNRYQTIGEDIADWEDPVSAVVNCREWFSDSDMVISSYGVGSRYQTIGEDIADRRLSAGCSEAQSVGISDNAMFTSIWFR